MSISDSDFPVTPKRRFKSKPKRGVKKWRVNGLGYGFEVTEAKFPNWLTTTGVYLKQQRLANEGFPKPAGWTMLTLTINQNYFDDELDAYLYLKTKITRVMKKVSEKLYEWGYYNDPSHCVYWYKMEFQANGWPHWHIFFNCLDKLPPQRLDELRKLWSFGRCRYDNLEGNPDYAYKYAFKAPFEHFQDAEAGAVLPQWFANFHQIVDGKPETFDRARFFQRSKNFLKHHSEWLVSLGKSPSDYKVFEPKVYKEPCSCQIQETVSDKLDRLLSKVQLIALNSDGSYGKSITVSLSISYEKLLSGHLLPMQCEGLTAQIKPNYYFVNKLPESVITEESKHKITKICQHNQLTLNKAQHLQRSRFKKLTPMDLPSEASLCPSVTLRNGKIFRPKRFSDYNKL